MKKNLRKLLSLLLCLMLCMSLFPAGTALAEEPEAGTAPERMAAEEVIPEEDDNYNITSFSELKALVEQGCTGYIHYSETKTFVFEEDLTLPETICFESYNADILIPAGVTVTANETLCCRNNTLFVEGVLIAEGLILKNINVGGSLQTDCMIFLPLDGEITGEENISFSGSIAYFQIGCDADSPASFEAAVQEANLNKPNRMYDISLFTEITIEDSIILGENVQFHVYEPLIIADGATLSLSGFMDAEAPVTINGNLENTGSLGIYVNYPNAILTLGSTGTYTGSGTITVNGETLSSPDEALPGFDLSEFHVFDLDQGKTWCLFLEKTGSIDQDEYGNYYIDNFAELKQLLAQEFTEHTVIYYTGSEVFVFEEDVTLPENTEFVSPDADIRIPSGVTVTADGEIECWGDTLYVEGTLVMNNYISLYNNIDVSGKLWCYSYICMLSTGEIAGEENIIFEDGAFNITYYTDSWETFIAAIQEANLRKPNREYYICHNAETVLTIEEEITVGDNADLCVESTLVVAKNGTLNFERLVTVLAPVTINGSMNNAGRIVIYQWSDPGASLTLGETGSYSGMGQITIYTDTLSSPDEALPGFDLTVFDVTGSAEEGWTLTLKMEEETKPGDANGDGKVNTMDLIRLMKHINGEEVEMAEGAGDVNGDGKVNTMDLIRLMKYINGEVI